MMQPHRRPNSLLLCETEHKYRDVGYWETKHRANEEKTKKKTKDVSQYT